MPTQPLRIAILLSGTGRTMVNVQERINGGMLRAEIVRVVSSRKDAPGLQRAEELGLETVVVDRKSCGDEAFERELTGAVQGADLVCMAGFLSLWRIPSEMVGRVINIHPALLPAFGGKGMYGARVHEAVLASGCTQSGCTVHYCDNEYDHGPIIIQRNVPVCPGDTTEALAARVFEQECIAYPEAIGMFAEDRIRLVGSRVEITS